MYVTHVKLQSQLSDAGRRVFMDGVAHQGREAEVDQEE